MAADRRADVYPMMRDMNQVERVNLIQYLWRETVGHLLHPQIPSDVSRIADVATATGLWLCELSLTRSNFERLDGFDASPSSFLLPSDLPSPVTLQVADAYKPVPEALRGQYDVVHIRAIQPGILDGNPSKVIEHCMALLRPGGYLQWEEFDTLDFDIHVAEGIARPSGLEQMIDIFRTISPKNWIGELPRLLETHGMLPIVTEKTRERPWHHLIMANMAARVLNEVAQSYFDVVGPPGSGDDVRAKTKAALEEAMLGSYASFLFQTVVAQKPLES